MKEEEGEKRGSLVLTIKDGDSFLIDGKTKVIIVWHPNGGKQVRAIIQAPKSISITREKNTREKNNKERTP